MEVFVTVFLSAMLLCIFSRAYARPSCDLGQFYDKFDRRCTYCTLMCPENTVVLEPCSRFKDTKCGPAEEFIFNPADFQSLKIQPSLKSTVAPTKPDDALQTGDTDSRRWFVVSMCLLGALGGVCLCVVIYIFASIREMKKKKKKEIIFNPVYLDRYPPSEEPRYVALPMSNDRLSRLESTPIPAVHRADQPMLTHEYVDLD